MLFTCFIDDVIADVSGARFDDPNLDRDHLGDLEDDSPYPEVRSAVANTDDPEMPCNTFRFVYAHSGIYAWLNSFQGLVPWPDLGYCPPRPQPVLFLPLSGRHYRKPRCPAYFISYGPLLGLRAPQAPYFWCKP